MSIQRKKTKVPGGRGGSHQAPQGNRNPRRFWGNRSSSRERFGPGEGSAICPSCFSSPRSLGRCQGGCWGWQMPDKQRSFGVGQSPSADYRITRPAGAPRGICSAPGFLGFLPGMRPLALEYREYEDPLSATPERSSIPTEGGEVTARGSHCPSFWACFGQVKVQDPQKQRCSGGRGSGTWTDSKGLQVRGVRGWGEWRML